MPVFSYRAYRPGGTVEAGRIEAENLQDASQQLLRVHKRPFSLEEIGARSTVLGRLRTPREISGQRSLNLGKLFSELSVLLDAGFTPVAALRIAASAESSPGARAKLSAIADELANGRSFSQAFAGLVQLPAEVRPMLASGESSGKIAEVISGLAESYRYRAEQRSAMLEALAYPAFLVLVIMGAVLFITLFLIPAIEPLFETDRASMPTTLMVFSLLGRLLNERWMVILTVVVAAGAGFLAAARSPAGRRISWNCLLHVPVVGRLIRETAIVRYLQVLSLLMGNSVPMIDALKLAAETCSVPNLQQRLSGIREDVAKGKRLNEACKQAGVFGGSTITLIEIGEEANNLPAVLRKASSLLDTQLKRSVGRLVTFLTPAITIFMGLMVGGLVVSVMTALLSINEVALN
ncbi:type II secretion system F family protein [Nitratireductor sp. ZSWI3]|uniref:type II secretion system F family protein n=1 Tax=Nitratireductor sp. ZSWI3 TaxID=2966359 RepID=UPI00214F660B|nr:type II secretion system F family protein [Nitratireductor sp. ZSWI3]MCR4265787.1 type II secretion system F family protein [Nitratireductor sp. ZSWI3]